MFVLPQKGKITHYQFVKPIVGMGNTLQTVLIRIELCPAKNSHIEALHPSVIVFGDGACGRELGCEDGDFVMGLVPL